MVLFWYSLSQSPSLSMQESRNMSLKPEYRYLEKGNISKTQESLQSMPLLKQDGVVVGEKALQSALKHGSRVETTKKVNAGKNRKSLMFNAARLEEDTEMLQHPTVTHEFRIALQRARHAKRMTQKDLGIALNEKATLINNYETGLALPDSQLINKMERTLGCKLPRRSQ